MGWNKPSVASAPSPTPKKKPTAWRGAAAGGVVVLAAIVAAVFIFSGGDAKPKAKAEKKPTAIKEVQPAVVVTNQSTEVAKEATAASKDDGVPKVWQGQPVIKHVCTTNDTLIFEKFYTADGKVHGYYHDERANALPSGADQILAIMTGHDGGFGAPPLPHMKDFESEFGRAIKQEIVVNENDSPEVKEVKERVIAARQELLQLMSEGRSANDVLNDWRQMQEDNATIRLDAVKKVREFLDAGDRAGAQELCDSYNKILEKSGIMKIELPPDGGTRNKERKE